MEEGCSCGTASSQAPTPCRDSYGFEVAQDLVRVHHLHVSERQEVEREAAWTAYLRDEIQVQCSEGPIDGLHSLAVLCLPLALAEIAAARAPVAGQQQPQQPLGSRPSSRAGPHSPSRPPLFDQRLHALVEQGVPLDMRGVAWGLFLGATLRREEAGDGFYSQLCGMALGPLRDRAQIEPEELRQQAAASADALFQAAPPSPSAAEDDGRASPRDALPAAPSSNGNPHSHELPAAGGDSPSISGASETAGLDAAAWAQSGKTWLQQIEKDLPRTFPGRDASFLECSKDTPALRRVLAAYALHNRQVGYCQGMNFVAGCLMQFMGEEHAFYCLCAIVEEVLPGYYTMDMEATQVDQRVFKRLIECQLPALAAHLDAVGTDISCVFAQWFLCAYVNFLPMETCVRVWDLLFLHGPGCRAGVLFAAALALLEVFQPAVMEAADVLDAFELVQSLPSLMHDADRLVFTMCTHFYHVLDGTALDQLRVEARLQLVEEREAEASARCEAAAHAERRVEAAAREAAEPPSMLDGFIKKLRQGFSDKDEKASNGKEGGRRPGFGDKSGISTPVFTPTATPLTSFSQAIAPGDAAAPATAPPRQSQPVSVPGNGGCTSARHTSADGRAFHHDGGGGGTAELSPCESTSPILLCLDSGRSASATSVDGLHMVHHAMQHSNSGRRTGATRTGYGSLTPALAAPFSSLAEDPFPAATSTSGQRAGDGAAPGAASGLTAALARVPAAHTDTSSSHRPAASAAAAAGSSDVAAAAHHCAIHGGAGPSLSDSTASLGRRRQRPKRSAAAELAMQIALEHQAPDDTHAGRPAGGAGGPAPRPAAAAAAAAAAGGPLTSAPTFSLVMEDDVEQPRDSHTESFRDEWVNIVVAQPPVDSVAATRAAAARPLSRSATPPPRAAALRASSVDLSHPQPTLAGRGMASSLAALLGAGVDVLRPSSRGPSRSPPPPAATATAWSPPPPTARSSTPTLAADVSLLQPLQPPPSPPLPQASLPQYGARASTAAPDGDDDVRAAGGRGHRDGGRQGSDSGTDGCPSTSARTDAAAIDALNVQHGVHDLWSQYQTLTQVFLQVQGESRQPATASAMERLSQIEQMACALGSGGGRSSRSPSLDGICFADDGSPLAPAPPAGAQAKQLLLLLGDVRRDLDGAAQQQQQQVSTMEVLHSLCQEMASKLMTMAPVLAEKDRWINALTSQTLKNATTQAVQDDKLADQENIISDLRQRLGHTKSGAAGGGGGGGGGSSSNAARPGSRSPQRDATGLREDKPWAQRMVSKLAKFGKDEASGLGGGVGGAA